MFFTVLFIEGYFLWVLVHFWIDNIIIFVNSKRY